MAGTIQITLNVEDNLDNRNLFNKFMSANLPESDAVKTKSSKTKDEPEESDSDISLADFKKAAKTVKKDFGEEFALEILSDHKVKVGTSLARSLSKVDEDDYESVINAWVTGPEEKDDDDLDEDDDDLDEDDDEDEELDGDAVALALKAYAKENGRDEAKELMKKHKVKDLAAVKKLTGKKLAALAKALA